MSNKFSRSRAIPLPYPKICKSKHPTPAVPPPWNDLALQLMLSIHDTFHPNPVHFDGVVTCSKTGPGYVWTAQRSNGAGTLLVITCTGNGMTSELDVVIDADQSGILVDTYLGHGQTWIPDQPYDSGTFDLRNTSAFLVIGTAHAMI